MREGNRGRERGERKMAIGVREREGRQREREGEEKRKGERGGRETDGES